ncbi:hypothetical protein BDN72DRAFT_134084 [Pluteus cervinus]|uniref:Uncharacterized protein n=1 Tax=Pluteus cervinus TaxID=181527 RepID=A0ACD3AMX5_9AGAR|nr:hypothetical protein BDN72DRAFT_134084 [Pluteus cervinus]
MAARDAGKRTGTQHTHSDQRIELQHSLSPSFDGVCSRVFWPLSSKALVCWELKSSDFVNKPLPHSSLLVILDGVVMKLSVSLWDHYRRYRGGVLLSINQSPCDDIAIQAFGSEWQRGVPSYLQNCSTLVQHPIINFQLQWFTAKGTNDCESTITHPPEFGFFQ